MQHDPAHAPRARPGPGEVVDVRVAGLAARAIEDIQSHYARAVQLGRERPDPPVGLLMRFLRDIGEPGLADEFYNSQVELAAILRELRAMGLGAVAEAFERRRPGDPGGGRG